MDSYQFEIVIILVLILANGVLSMSEMALVSARAARLEPAAKAGSQGAKIVLDLIKEPGTFLSTLQIGVTLVGILVGVFSGGMIAQVIAARFAFWAALAPYSQTIAVGIVVAISTYLTLVIGELVPKQLGLRYAEKISILVAPPLAILSRITSVLVKILDLSTRAVLRLLGLPASEESSVSEDEVRFMLRQGTDMGVFEPLEHDMLARVFRLADQRMGALLTPRPDIVWLDRDDSPAEIRRKVVESGRSRFPVGEGDLDRVVGVVLAKDLFAQETSGEEMDLVSIMRPPIFVPETAPALTAVERMILAQSKIALVIDEYGGLAGLVTIDDVLGAIVGEIIEDDEEPGPMALERADGSWLVDGMMTISDFCELFGLPSIEADRSYTTVGGLVMTNLGQVPQTGDVTHWHGLELEVMDMDGRRVDKILTRRMAAEEAQTSHESDEENDSTG